MTTSWYTNHVPFPVSQSVRTIRRNFFDVDHMTRNIIIENMHGTANYCNSIIVLSYVIFFKHPHRSVHIIPTF